jgi:hypothetical protein
MFAGRFFLFKLHESPKFLLSRGRQSEAIDVVQKIAHYNGTKTWLDMETFNKVLDGDGSYNGGLTIADIRKRNLSQFSFEKLRSLFKGYKMSINTILLWFIWTT